MKLIQTILRGLAAAFFVVAGTFHFFKPEMYLQIMPPYFPAPQLLVAVSGVAEIAGGVGLVIRPLRRVAGWGLIALLIAVFPANIYMLQHPGQFNFTQWILWARLRPPSPSRWAKERRRGKLTRAMAPSILRVLL